MTSFQLLRHRRNEPQAFLYAFDLLEHAPDRNQCAFAGVNAQVMQKVTPRTFLQAPLTSDEAAASNAT